MIIRGYYQNKPFILTTDGDQAIGAGPGWNPIGAQLEDAWGKPVSVPLQAPLKLTRGDDAALTAWLAQLPGISFQSWSGVPPVAAPIPTGAIA